MSEQDNVDVVRQLYSDFGEGNVEGILNVLTEDVEWKEPHAGKSPLAGTWHGHEGVADFFRTVDEVTETEDFQPKDYIAQGNKVVVLGHYRFLVKSTGKRWGSEWAMVWTLRDAKIAEFQFFGDTEAEAAAFE